MEAQLNVLFANAIENGVQQKQLGDAINVNTENSKPKYLVEPKNYRKYFLMTVVIALLVTVGLPRRAFKSPVRYTYDLFYANVYDPEGNCLLTSGQLAFDVFRPVVSCDICKGMNGQVRSL